ncbi:MAG: penicillin-binding transpeptidase domain-containing protein [Erysipelotrichaceae bacterium]|nr:penicillin-binding transpeptidase domain-containing protein [Erysipelotrichaceae bacterium]MDP3306292.1 penicillin-binding transpeptidase domain-containing protein [Erysipelotrichaceae bacterium]
MNKKSLVNQFKKNQTSSIRYGEIEQMTRPADIQKSVTFRLQIFGVVIVVLMATVLFRLYQVQVVDQQLYQDRLEIYTRRFQTVTTPRGEILDRYGEILVANSEQLVITYLPPLHVTESERWELAYLFADNFDVSAENLRNRDLKDLFIMLHSDEATLLIKDSEWDDYRSGRLSDNDIYLLKIDRITETMLLRFDEKTRRAFVVKQAMDMPTGGREKVIKLNASKAEVAYLIEHINLYRGFNVAINWSRDYPQGSTLRTIMGNVSTSQQGLPAERLISYLALDYSRNDNVGTSGIELKYEDVLRGARSVYSLNYDTEGIGLLNTVIEGSKGYDIITTFDLGWQLHAEEVVKRILNAHVNNKYRKYMDRIFFVMTKPQTGDVLIAVGVVRTEDGYIIDSTMTYTDAMVIGSSVKGATIYMGLTENVVGEGEVIRDEPIKIRDTEVKKSHRNLGLINDLTALSMSSNVYMFHIAMRLGGAKYEYDGPLRIDLNAFNTMRNYYSQFGLGTNTRIDLPNEQTGYKGAANLGGHLLDFAIGQYDTYTTLQMAQYVATIANNGVRLKLRTVKEAYQSSTDFMVYQNPPEILSVLSNESAIRRVQQGFRLCVTDGLCRSYLSSMKVGIAAKTGTAESVAWDGSQSPNSTLVGYAPYNNPEVAFSCAVPNSWNDIMQTNICQQITAEILKYRYE